MAFYGYQDPNIDQLTGRPRVPGSIPGMPIPRPVVAPQAAQAPQPPLGVGGLPQLPQIVPQAPPPMPTAIDTMPPPPSMPDLSAVDNPPPDLRPTNVRDLTAPSLTTPSIPDVPQTSQPYRDALAYELANPPKPKLWQRLAAGAVGGLAGAVNASGRTRIDPNVTADATRGILMGGYDDRVARAVSLAGLERQREQDAENARYKEAQITQMGESSSLRKSQDEANRLYRQGQLDDRERNDYIAMRQMGGEIVEPGMPPKPGYELAPFKIQGKNVQVPTGATSRRLAKQAEIEATSIPSNPILAKWYKEQTGQDLKPTLTKQENEDLLRIYDTQTKLAATSTQKAADRELRNTLAQYARDSKSTAASAREDASLDKVVTMLGKRFEKQTGTEIQSANLHKRIIDSSLDALAKDPKSSGASKFAIVYNFIKLLDNNAVREGEVAAVNAAMPLYSRAKAMVDKGIGYGGNIDDSFAKQIADAANTIWQGYQSNYAANVKQAVALAREQGIPDKKISLILNRPFAEVQDLLKDAPAPGNAPVKMPSSFIPDKR